MVYWSRPSLFRQNGAALLVLMLILMVGLSAMMLSGFKPRDPEIVRREQSAAALQAAKQALLAWSLTRDGTVGTGNCSPTSSPNGRACAPLELPCPADPNETAINTIGTSISSCNSANNPGSRIGWLPWKTLGIPQIVDAYGEPLWYSVDYGFVVRTQDTEARKINSDSLSALRLFQLGDEISTLGQNPAAVIFAAGPPLAGQLRNKPYSTSQFLEGYGANNNATLAGPFVSAPLSATFNDLLAVVTGDELIEEAQARLGTEIANQFLRYWQAYQASNPTVAQAVVPQYGNVPQKATAAAAAACAPVWSATSSYQTGDVVSETPGNSSNWKNYTAKSASIGVSPQGSPAIWGAGTTCTAATPSPVPTATPIASAIPTAVPAATPVPASLPEIYPYPADIVGDANCRDNVLYPSNVGCRSKANLCTGILPRAGDDWTGLGKLSTPASNGLPTWFHQNIWHRAILYAVKQGASCSSVFYLDGSAEPTIDAIYILPGAPRSARADNLKTAAAASSDLTLYLEDVGNQNKWLNPNDRNFVSPTCASNDQMYTCQQGVCSLREKTC